jgi:uncharacterized protein YbjT (DUF2867 family)
MATDTRTRRIFIAGATGATGRTVTRLAEAGGVPLVAHVRPKSAAKAPAHAAILELSDHAALVEALRGCTTVVQLIGTMRKRFAAGDTYETSDIGTTKQLVDAAKEAGVDHLVLLSSVGAGSPRGAYLQAKAKAEALVTGSGLAFTIFRPSAFVGEEHQPPKLLVALGTALFPAKYKPIRLEQLAGAILRTAVERGPLGVLEGASLWAVAR